MSPSVSNPLKAFIAATRPRTYPLAMAGIIVGNALAYSHIGSFTPHNWGVFIGSLWVALGLQILSNLANDYGDTVKGTDQHRPDRQISQNQFDKNTFKQLIMGWALLVFCAGVALVLYSFVQLFNIILFIGLGVVAIIAAIAYTMGNKPYGYHAKGEIAVFIFFGLVNVLGGSYLQTQFINVSDILVAISIGLLCSCVLMINNMRDIDTDMLSHKKTLVVYLGKQNSAKLYTRLLATAYFLCLVFAILRQNYWLTSLFLLAPKIKKHLVVIKQYQNNQILPYELTSQLKTIVLITLDTSLLLSISILIFNFK